MKTSLFIYSTIILLIFQNCGRTTPRATVGASANAFIEPAMYSLMDSIYATHDLKNKMLIYTEFFPDKARIGSINALINFLNDDSDHSR